MKRAILTLLSVLVFCEVVSGYERSISWVEGVNPPNLGITPAKPTSTDLIYFTIPTDTFPDQLTAEEALGGTATLSILPASRTVRLRFQGQPTAPFSEFAPQVSGLRGYFGPLEQGTWLFDVQFPGTFWQVNIDVNPPTIFRGVKAEYFEDTIPQGTPCWTQFEPGINNNWGNNVIACDRSDYVSARWTATLVVEITGTYTFYTNNDDGVRLYIDRRRIIDDWNDSGIIDHQSIPLTLEEGFYPLVMEWYHNSGTAIARLYWETSTMTRQIIPADQLIAPQLDPSPGQETGPVIEPESFEYFSAQNRIYQTWIGGSRVGELNNGTGMTVGHPNPPYVEETIVYSGEQSMPLYYNNFEPPFYSQADRTWDSAQDWTIGENENINYRNYLSLQVRGKPGNSPDPLYIRVEDTQGRFGVVFNPDSGILSRNDWTSWWIPLSDFADAGVDLKNVRKLSIGMGEPPLPNDIMQGGLINDDCSNPICLYGNVRDHQFDTTDCQYDGPASENCMHSPNIWYCYTPLCTGNVTVSLCGSSYDTMLAVYNGYICPPQGKNLIRCNDDACGSQSEITFYAYAGNEYMIEVGGWTDTSWGPGVLNISCEVDYQVASVLGNGPKLLVNPDLQAIIDQLAIFGITTIPSKVSGIVRDNSEVPPSRMSDAKVSFVKPGWTGEFWDKTDDGGNYEVELIQGIFDITVTHPNNKPFYEYRSQEVKDFNPEINFPLP